MSLVSFTEPDINFCITQPKNWTHNYCLTNTFFFFWVLQEQIKLSNLCGWYTNCCIKVHIPYSSGGQDSVVKKTKNIFLLFSVFSFQKNFASHNHGTIERTWRSFNPLTFCKNWKLNNKSVFLASNYDNATELSIFFNLFPTRKTIKPPYSISEK